MARSKSSARWLREHHRDVYVKQARQEGYRSRAVYKLKEIDAKDRLFKAGLTVVDLGAAPGGWSQYAVERIGDRGQVLALDLLAMDSLAGVHFIQGDFQQQETLDTMLAALQGKQLDLVISDMAPNKTGIRAVDQPRAMYLAELTVDFAKENLRPGGNLLMKVFQGEGFEALLADLRRNFGSVASRKPQASRGRSQELYLLARNHGV